MTTLRGLAFALLLAVVLVAPAKAGADELGNETSERFSFWFVCGVSCGTTHHLLDPIPDGAPATPENHPGYFDFGNYQGVVKVGYLGHIPAEPVKPVGVVDWTWYCEDVQSKPIEISGNDSDEDPTKYDTDRWLRFQENGSSKGDQAVTAIEWTVSTNPSSPGTPVVVHELDAQETFSADLDHLTTFSYLHPQCFGWTDPE